MAEYIRGSIVKIYSKLIRDMSSKHVGESEFTNQVIEKILLFPPRRNDLTKTAIHILKPYIDNLEKRNPDGQNSHLKILKTVSNLLRLELTKSIYSETETVIHEQIFSKFESLFVKYHDIKDNGHSKIKSDNFLSYIIEIANKYPHKKVMIFETAIGELEFHLKLHKEICNNPECLDEKLIRSSVVDLNYYKDSILNDTVESIESEITSSKVPVNGNYIDEEIINKFASITTELDITKLVKICNELNFNWNHGNYFAVSALVRMLLHYIPPFFGDFKTWRNVAENYKDKAESKKVSSFSDICKNLLSFIDTANIIAHQKASHSDFVPNKTSTDKRDMVDTVLQKIYQLQSVK